MATKKTSKPNAVKPEEKKEAKTYYQTSDGIKFYTENDALNHAKTLEKKEVKPVKA